MFLCVQVVLMLQTKAVIIVVTLIFFSVKDILVSPLLILSVSIYHGNLLHSKILQIVIFAYSNCNSLSSYFNVFIRYSYMYKSNWNNQMSLLGINNVFLVLIKTLNLFLMNESTEPTHLVIFDPLLATRRRAAE